MNYCMTFQTETVRVELEMLKGNSSQNTSAVHIKDLTNFNLLPKFQRCNQLS